MTTTLHSRTTVAVRAASRPRSRAALAWSVTAVLLLGSVAAAVVLGPVPVPLEELLAALAAGPAPTAPGPVTVIVWDIRLPRALLGAVVGAALGVAGAVIQSVLRNSLADPYVIGVSSGAALGAVVALLAAGVLPALAVVGSIGVPVLSFAGALGAFALVYGAARGRYGPDPVRLLLAGVAVAALLSAATQWVVLLADNSDVRAALYWTLGSLSGARWDDLTLPSVTLVLLTAWTTLRARTLNALAMGDEQAVTLGIDVARQRRRLLTMAALLVAVTVSVAGAVLFFALIVPHLARRMVGADHRRLLAFCAAGGALLMVWFDLIARLLAQPSELPLGVVTSLVGAAFFLVVLGRRVRERSG